LCSLVGQILTTHAPNIWRREPELWVQWLQCICNRHYTQLIDLPKPREGSSLLAPASRHTSRHPGGQFASQPSYYYNIKL